MSATPLVFDLDGVIVKTNFVKHAGMLSLFAEDSSQQDAISQYILANGGVPRREKLTHLLRTLQESELAASCWALDDGAGLVSTSRSR